MHNSLIHRDRRLSHHPSAFVRQFAVEDVDCLIICRGPIRREVMDVLTEMGAKYAILLSEKDSITYQNALAPELRLMADPTRVHRVPDYTGATKEERTQRIAQIIQIAKDNGHNAIFAGYGFMAEDAELVRAIEHAGLLFIGPCARTVRQAGLKDEAKRTALAAEVSVVPGVDDLTTRTLLAKAEQHGGLEAVARDAGLAMPASSSESDNATELLDASYQAGIDLITVDEIAAQAEIEVRALFRAQPNNWIRLKAIGGGGGKGQRILKAPKDYSGTVEDQVQQASSQVPGQLREVLQEVKATGVGDNKNVLIELNIETTRHQEIQVIGNGQWCLTLGGRDCSLQMHEQKLLEVSTTLESLESEQHRALATGDALKAAALATDRQILERMEGEATRFGEAVGLDSVSTFECIVDADQHFFMEMNTRIQVEHRVSELCYQLQFSNPNDPSDQFTVDSLVEAMVLIAKHKTQLPKPARIPREAASVEARLNATNAGLAPHAGGVIEHWSNPITDEVRDDQGIGVRNPDTGAFMKYTLAGAYDSNIALLLTVGSDRRHSYQRMAEVLRAMVIDGQDVQTNLNFHYGLVHWFLAHDVHAKSTTAFIQPYLTLAGLLAGEVRQLNLDWAWTTLAEDSVTPDIFDRKRALVLRPLQVMINDPHLLIGWIALTRDAWSSDATGFQWHANPFGLLAGLYHYLNMDADPKKPAAAVIWDHDAIILDQGQQFYRDLATRFGVEDWQVLCACLDAEPPAAMEPLWEEIQAAHRGFQAGLELLGLVVQCALAVDFDALGVHPDLTVDIPDRLRDPEVQARARKILIPPPTADANEIVAVSGGMFYAQETPGTPNFLDEGTHFDIGDPLYIIEVMKMFNKVYAEFAGTVTEVLIERGDGVIVKKGQPLYRIEPDEKSEQRDLDSQQAVRLTYTREAVQRMRRTA